MAEQIITKKCTKCKEIKLISEFSKDVSKKDGLRSHCKQCDSKAGRKYHSTERGKISRKLRKLRYYSTEKGRERNRQSANRRYRDNEIFRHNSKERVYKRRKEHPDRVKANAVVKEAIRRKILPLPKSFKCFCGARAKAYHHYLGYKPKNWFDVVAICYSCHGKIHLSPSMSEIETLDLFPPQFKVTLSVSNPVNALERKRLWTNICITCHLPE